MKEQRSAGEIEKYARQLVRRHGGGLSQKTIRVEVWNLGIAGAGRVIRDYESRHSRGEAPMRRLKEARNDW